MGMAPSPPAAMRAGYAAQAAADEAMPMDDEASDPLEGWESDGSLERGLRARMLAAPAAPLAPPQVAHPP
eukprot:1778481-Lingulodinium_polyedra.AAC.1